MSGDNVVYPTSEPPYSNRKSISELDANHRAAATMALRACRLPEDRRNGQPKGLLEKSIVRTIQVPSRAA
jgi:hypothetical protein